MEKKNRKYLIILMMSAFAALVLVTFFFMTNYIKSYIINAVEETQAECTISWSISETPSITAEPTLVAEFESPISTEPVPQTEIQELIEEINNSDVIAEITIATSRKTKTYDVMQDVDGETLKHNLGYLPTSTLPGKEGLCVIMGHRDTQFAMLKYCDVGDSIVLKIKNITYEYIVQRIEIIENDNLLVFSVREGHNLALVSCYPFNYIGHASQKIVYYARLSS